MIKYLILIISIVSFQLEANSFFPTEKQKNHVVKKKFTYEEQEISYFIYIPKKSKRPKMNFIFHGEYSKAEDFLNKTQIFNELRNKNESLIAFNSTANDWYANKRKNIKDKKFIVNLIKESFKLGFEEYNIIGYSSGGTLVNELICEEEINRGIKNVITINSSGKKEWINNCKLPNGLNYYSILGTEDDYYTYEDINKKSKKHKIPEEDFLPSSEFLDLLRIKMNCSTDFIKTGIEKDITDGTYITKRNYSCHVRNKNNLTLYIVEKMGHNFPLSIDYPLEDFRGKSSKDLDILTIRD